jgi:phosphoribosylamine--glycine ligase
VVEELARRGTPFHGVLYAGLMLTAAGPQVLEFNVRFGDPETQAVLPLLETDLLAILAAAAGGDLAGISVSFGDSAAVTVVLAARDYPAEGDRGNEITGVEEAEEGGALVFHASTARQGERLVTNGGRILGITGLGPTVGRAREAAYEGMGRVRFEGMRFRSDIAGAAAEGATVSLDLPTGA